MTADLVLAPSAGEQALQQCEITIVHAAENLTTKFVLQAGSVVRLGRAASNDVVLKDASASGHHAELFLCSPGAQELSPTITQELCIRDGSRNGTGVRPPPSACGASVELAPGLDRLGWERLAKGGVRKLADGWQLKLPLRSRRGERQVPEALRTWSLRVRFVDVQAPQVPASRKTSGGDAKVETVRRRKKDKGLETDGVEPKKPKREKKAKKHLGAELPLRGVPSSLAEASTRGDTVPTEQSSLAAPCPSPSDQPDIEKSIAITEHQQVATPASGGADDEAAKVAAVGSSIQPLTATPPQDAGTGISSAPRTERPLGRKEQWERKRRERIERERAARESGGDTVPAHDQPPVGAAESEHVAFGQASQALSSTISLARDGDPSQKSAQPARAKAGGGERVDSSPEGGAADRRGVQLEPLKASAPTPPLAAAVGAPAGGPPVKGMASTTRAASSTTEGAGHMRLTEAAVKAVATAAAAARGQRHEQQEAAEAWRRPGLGVDRSGLVGQSLLRDMSISPISTPGVGRKKRRKQMIPDQSSSDGTANLQMEAKRKKKDKKKKKKKAETETGATEAVRGSFGMAGPPPALTQRPTHTSGARAVNDGHGRVVANPERGASPERWNPSPPPMAHRDETPSRRKEPSRLQVHGPALAANAKAPAKAVKTAKAAKKDKDKSRKSARDQLPSSQAKRKRSRSAGKEARKKNRQRHA